MNPLPLPLLLAIRANIPRRPLWKIQSAATCLGIEVESVMDKIQSGELPWAFDIGKGKTRPEPRVLAHSVVELAQATGGKTGARKLQWQTVIDLILPKRDIRSTELKRILGCSHQQVYQLAAKLTISRKPKAHDGPHSYTVFSRASIEAFLAQRRVS